MIDSWTTATAAAAFLLYVYSLISRFRSASDSRRLAIKIEAVAWLVLVVHVGFAFHEHHHWSHAVAETHVAEETEQTLGLRWGGGIYFNHALLVLWGIAIWRRWQTARRRRYETNPIDQGIDIYVALMWFSATVVFGSTGFRILGIIGFGLMAQAIWQARRQQLAHSAENHTST